MKKSYFNFNEKKNSSFFPSTWKFLFLCFGMMFLMLQSNAQCNLQMQSDGDDYEPADNNCEFTLPDYTINGWINNMSDDCGAFTLSQSPASSSIVSDGAVVTVTMTDNGDNTQFITTSFTVHVLDLTPPNFIVCQGDTVGYTDNTCNFTLPDYTLLVSAVDNCTGVTFSQVPAAATGVGAGVYTIYIYATDDAQNQNVCQFNLTVINATPPGLTCPGDQTFSTDVGQCTFTQVNGENDPIVNENCSAVTLSYLLGGATQGSGFTSLNNLAFNIGTTSVNWTATDGFGNTSSCSFNAFVTPLPPNIINCPLVDDNSLLVDNNCQYIVPDYITIHNIYGTDLCAPVVVTQDPIAGTVETSINSVTVTFTATAGVGNTSTCSINIFPQDAIVPAIICRTDQGVPTDLGSCSYTVAGTEFDPIAASDNCAGFSLSNDQNGLPTLQGVTFNSGLTSVTWTITDVSGNTATCSFNVTVNDNEAPVIDCPTTQYVAADNTCNYALVDFTSLAAGSDNCGTVIFSQDPAFGDQVSIGTSVVTITANDGNGNTASCTFNLVVEDQTPPNATCPSDQSVSVDNTCSYLLLDYTSSVTATDNCSSVNIFQNPSVNAVETLGETVIVMTVADQSGNTAECLFSVFGIDDTPPVIGCPSDQNVSETNNCNYTIIDFTAFASASDNCGNVTMTQDPVSGTIVGTGTTVVTLTADDGNGNTATCSFNLNVSDNTPPSLVCVSNANRNGICSYTVSGSEFDAVATDNCDAITSLTYDMTGTTVGSGSTSMASVILNIGTTTVTWTATDAEGNTASCSNTIIVNQTSITLPYTEIFATQDCWTIEQISGNSDWYFSNTMNTGLTPVSGEMLVFPSSTAPNGTASRLITPLLDFTSVTEPVLNYHYATDNGSQQPDSLAVSISTDGGNTYTFLRSALRKRATAASWTLFAIDLSPYAHMSNIKLSFTGVSAGGGNDMAIDDVHIFDANCSAPVNFSSNAVTYNSATVQWQAGPSGTPVDYLVRWSTSTSDLATWNQITLSGNTTSYNITGLANNTTIYWQVKADCGTNVTAGYPIAYQSFHTITCPSLSITSNRPNLYLCSGGNVTLTATAGFSSYSWSNTSTSQATTISTANFYSVTATFAGCPAAHAGITITQDPAINLASPYYFNQVNEACNGGNTGKINVSPAGGFAPYTYSWSPNGATTATISNLTAGNYVVTVTDSKGCTLSKSANIGQPTAILLGAPTHLSQVNVSCNGGNNGIINVNPAGGTPGYTYSWTPSEGTNATISNLVAGTYTVTVSDANHCTKTNSTTISQVSPIKLVSPNYFTQSNVTCFNGNNGIIRVNPTGGSPGYTYSWTPSEGTNATISNLVAGTYTVTVTDVNLCTATKSTIIAQPSQILIGAPQHETQTNPTCVNGHNGVIRMNPAGGMPPYHYTWSPIVATTATVTGLAAGTYNVTVTDANNCTVSNSIVLVCTSRIEDPNGDVLSSTNYDFNVYPNPAEGIVTIAFNADNENSYKLSLIDMMGRVVKTDVDNSALGENLHTINLESISKGVYMILLQQGDNTYKSKLLVE